MTKRHEETLVIESKENTVVGRVEGVKPVNKKWEKTILGKSELDSSDIYVEVKKIDMPKEKMVRHGTTGVTVPEEYFPSEESSISKEKLIKLFKNCDEYIFNLSNRDFSFPVTCMASNTNKSISFFINLHEKEEQKVKLCQDHTNLRVGHVTVKIMGEELEEIIKEAQSCYHSYMLSSSGSFLKSYFKEPVKDKRSLFEKFVDFLVGKPDKNFLNSPEPPVEDVLLVDDNFVDTYLIEQKTINVRKVYP